MAGQPKLSMHTSKTNEDRYTRTTGVLSLDWGKDGTLITGGRDRRVRVWKVDGSRYHDHSNLNFFYQQPLEWFIKRRTS